MLFFFLLKSTPSRHTDNVQQITRRFVMPVKRQHHFRWYDRVRKADQWPVLSYFFRCDRSQPHVILTNTAIDKAAAKT